MSGATRCPSTYCDCVYTHHYDENGVKIAENFRVPTRKVCAELQEAGIETWVGPMVSSTEELKAAVERGINVVCSDQPADTLRMLRELGYHD